MNPYKSSVPQVESQKKGRYHRRAECSMNYPEIQESASLLDNYSVEVIM